MLAFNLATSEECIQCHKEQLDKHKISHHYGTFSKKNNIKPSDLSRRYLKNFYFSLGSGKRGKSFFIRDMNSLKTRTAAIATFKTKIIKGEGQNFDLKLNSHAGAIIDESCLYCHTGNIQTNNKQLVLSKINCKTCHNMKDKHVSNPRLHKEINIHGPKPLFNSCSSCHSNPEGSNDLIHANQAKLLPLSKCYNEEMKCQSCHDPHTLTVSQNSCTQCHNPKKNPHFKVSLDQCVQCHMPKVEIGMTVESLDGKKMYPKVRNHTIKVHSD